MSEKKREFKDLAIYDPYEYLNSEITGDYDKAHAVKCVNGTFVGTEENGVASWLGIPYAKAPVGERRFKAPEYVDGSDRVFEAKYYGKCAFGAGYPDCIQKLLSEDCLYLNIWVNADDKTEKKPVMVWIHGGAYVAGSGSQASYSGANLVQKQSDIIMVNINYRLNMYGFMDFSSVPGGENFKTAPCNGLLDQAMALRWVHENIAAFGGDPDNVTIFGQSAGGGSVSILPVMKEANQYFQKVIAQSGSTTLAFPVSCEAAQGKTKALLEYTGCKTMDDIMALSEEELQKAYVEAVGKFTSCPYYGTEVLPEAPIELYKKGHAKHISIMAGSTADEARLFMGEGPCLNMEEQKLFAQRAVGDAAKCLKEEDKKYYKEFWRVCRSQEPGLIETEFINELMFRVPMLQQLDAQSAFNKTFCYYWSYPGSNAEVGAAHSVELIFVFDIRCLGTSSTFNGTNISEEIYAAVQQMWTNFARRGNPSTEQIEWKAYSADDQNVLDIAGPGDIRIKKGLLSDQYKAVLPLLGYYQFMDKFFTPGYLLEIVAARETRKEEKLDTKVKCNNGTFVGKKTDELIIWKGIPYATQPVGKLRWKKALPAADDNGVYDAINPGHVPIGPLNDSMGTAEFGEDCLVLNVYCNTSCTDSKKPVMVWIHGGGFCAESQASPLYDLTSISKQCPDIIFVSIDYRLGFMGFMNFERVPGGENFKEAGNLGLLDQLEALRWVQKNIAGFGGNPDNVTIFGESAGSASVTFLPLIDGSEGLFKRCIAQSANIAYCDTMEHGIHVTQNFLTATGCQTMDELMELTTEQLVDAYQKAYAIDKNCLLGGANFPLLDGVTLPEDRAVMYGMWGDEKRSKIDLMIGSNLDEIRYFVPLEGGEEAFANTLRWIAKRDRALLNDQEKAMYDEFMATLANESELSRLEQYCNDINFRAGNTNMAIRHAAAGGNTYMYFIKKPVITPELGAIHAVEITYLFDTCILDPMGSEKIVGTEDCEFRHVAKEMWTNFARTGNPSTDKYEWKKFSGDDRQTMVFDDTIGMKKDIFGRREDLMMSWAERLGNGSSKRVC